MGQPPPALAAAPRKPRGRRLWFDLHSWVGLKLCLFMGFVCFTGTLAVLAHEIDWLLHPEIRVAPGPERASWGTMLAAARYTYPDWSLTAIEAPEGSRFAARVRARTAEGRLRFVWVDPYRGAVTGDTHWFNAHRFLRNTHRHLMLPVRYGVPLVAALSIPLAISLVSSLYIYRHWWRGFFAGPRRERPRRFWGDVHRLAGVWSLGFVALMALTGGWYLVESLGGGAGPPQKLQAAPAGMERVPNPAGASAAVIDRAVAEARARWPAFEVRAVTPGTGDETLLLQGEAEAILVRPRANAMAFTASDGAWIGRRDGRHMSVHQRIAEMADPLHFGNFAGLPVKLLWFLFGVLLTGLCVTGVYLYGLRVAEALRSATRRGRGSGVTAAAATGAAAAEMGSWRSAWRGMGRWRWLWVALLLTWLALLPLEAVK
ncbi:PepSY domain-containing protein [Luteimonas sp. SJ-92]|uniref:PepSY domain-containing protein n=1 Tax=Luteimonas salinisoli TaxID=2752307 RepID=A0A853JDA2_9GAMM|nr:PepSY-associated TM helix domain-containing protein [Luteimonas salinisoli]NZA26815.1 PepSY domain-containing protein [Luteimonas salinisoli]